MDACLNSAVIHHVLVDYENVQVKSLSLLTSEQFRICIFLGPNNAKLPVDLVQAMQGMGSRATYEILHTSGKNALDFLISFKIGKIAAEEPGSFIHVVSKDTGFDPLLQHIKTQVAVARSASIEAMPCFAVAQAMLAPARQINPPIIETGDPLLKLVLSDIFARTENRPKTAKALQNRITHIIRGSCSGKPFGKTHHRHASRINAKVIEQGLVRLDGVKVVYLDAA